MRLCKALCRGYLAPETKGRGPLHVTPLMPAARGTAFGLKLRMVMSEISVRVDVLGEGTATGLIRTSRQETL